MLTILKAPKGKMRVVGVYIYYNSEARSAVIDDYDEPEEAFRIANEHNNRPGSQSDHVYYVFNEQGEHILEDRLAREAMSA